MSPLRARCPSCSAAVPVRHTAAGWRMAAHAHDGARCPVRGVAARPGIDRWLAEQHQEAERDLAAWEALRPRPEYRVQAEERIRAAQERVELLRRMAASVEACDG